MNTHLNIHAPITRARLEAGSDVCARLVQRPEHSTDNREITSSNLVTCTGSTDLFTGRRLVACAAVAQLEEHRREAPSVARSIRARSTLRPLWRTSYDSSYKARPGDRLASKTGRIGFDSLALCQQPQQCA